MPVPSAMSLLVHTRLLQMWAMGIGQLSPHLHLSPQSSGKPRILDWKQALQAAQKGYQGGRVAHFIEHLFA